MSWRVGSKSGHNVNCIYDGDDNALCQVYGLPMHSRVDDPYLKHEKNVALLKTASVISAAPDLLTALKWFIDDIDGFHTVMVDFDKNVDRARAAIAKAEGRS